MRYVGGGKRILHVGKVVEKPRQQFEVLVIGRSANMPGNDIINLNIGRAPFTSLFRARCALEPYPKGIIRNMDGKVVEHKGLL